MRQLRDKCANKGKDLYKKNNVCLICIVHVFAIGFQLIIM